MMKKFLTVLVLGLAVFAVSCTKDEDVTITEDMLSEATGAITDATVGINKVNAAEADTTSKKATLIASMIEAIDALDNVKDNGVKVASIKLLNDSTDITEGTTVFTDGDKVEVTLEALSAKYTFEGGIEDADKVKTVTVTTLPKVVISSISVAVDELTGTDDSNPTDETAITIKAFTLTLADGTFTYEKLGSGLVTIATYLFEAVEDALEVQAVADLIAAENVSVTDVAAGTDSGEVDITFTPDDGYEFASSLSPESDGTLVVTYTGSTE